MKKLRIIASAGMAIFAMLFGSGNIVFPLGLGRDTGSQVWYAIAGLFITAVLVPLIGLVSTMLVDGDYRKLLGRLGIVPAAIITFVSLMLIGPFGVIPRCITIAYAAVQWYVPTLSLLVFSIITSAIIFLFTFQKTAVISIIGNFLGPIKLTLLLSIIAFGVYYSLPFPAVDLTPAQSVMRGVIEGLWTLDLLGTIFFAGLILSHLKKNIHIATKKELAWISIQASCIGALLIGLVYIGFCIVAAMYGESLTNIETSQILAAVSVLILGAKGGVLTNITVAIACLTTAIALTTVFTDYLRSLCNNKIAHVPALLITLAITTVMAHLGFATIMTLIAPVVKAFYPALIMLALVNILHELVGFKWIKTPVALTFVVTIALTYWELVMSCTRLYIG